jgi:hypothetical protein
LKKSQIEKLFAYLALADVPGWNVPEPGAAQAKVAIWADILGEVDGDQLIAAARAHMRGSRFAPTPADLIERIAPPANQADAALEAWVDACGIAQVCVGRDPRDLRPEDEPLERAVYTCGGWLKLYGLLRRCRVGEYAAQKDLDYMRRDFLEAFRSFARHAHERFPALPETMTKWLK